MTPLPLAELDPAYLKAVRVVMTDIDDTLTLHGKLPAVAFEAMERLQKAGFKVVPITGRPAGWCDHIARMWPVDGVVGENGAFYFRHDATSRKVIRHYALPETERRANKVRLFNLAQEVLARFPGTALASDQDYRAVDVAIDFCEDVPPLPIATAYGIADFFSARDAVAKVSSIHVNAWIGSHDKLSMSLKFLEDCHGLTTAEAKNAVAYCGDSPNDAPMFGFFTMSVGVANIAPFLDRIEHPPRVITQAAGGNGFAEFADMLLNVAP
jgi:HAD superfamily hydrolase (TIGR01484 family)